MLQLESVPPQLSIPERNRLHELERTLERTLHSFLEAGAALIEIREQRLYRDRYATFERYCQQRWAITAHRALAIVRSTEVAQHLLAGPAGPNGDAPLPANLAEQTLRPLQKLEPELQSACWRLASRISEKPSAQIVSRIVRTVETALHSGNGAAKIKLERPRKETFLPSVYRLAGNECFAAQVLVSHIDTAEKARRCCTACKTLINRCEALLRELDRHFPGL